MIIWSLKGLLSWQYGMLVKKKVVDENFWCAMLVTMIVAQL